VFLRHTSLITLALLSLFATHAAADEAPDKQRCLDAYAKSQPLRRDGKLSEARQELLLCARDPCPKQLQPDCVGWLEEVDRALPSVILRATDARGNDVSDVSVSLDGKPFVSRLDGRALSVDPGSHVFRFERTGKAPVEQSIVIREGEKRRRVVVQLEAPVEKPRPSAAQPAAASSGPPWTAYALGGVGIVALGTFAYFGLSGVSDRNQLDNCKPNCSSSAVERVDRKFWVANIALAVSAAALGGATVIFLSHSNDKRATSTRLTIGLAF
jgi:hypothetical protein